MRNVFRKGDAVIVKTRSGEREGTVERMMAKPPFDLQVQIDRTLHFYPQADVRHKPKKERGS